MTKLKTLKEVTEYNTLRIKEHIDKFGKGKNRDIDPAEKAMFLSLPKVFERDIKAEAIEWVKEDLDKIRKINNRFERFSRKLLLETWMERLNITEEDLK